MSCIIYFENVWKYINKMSFRSWSEDNKKQEYQHFLNFEEYTVLNFMAPLYHSAFGYNLDEHYLNNETIASPFMLELVPDIFRSKNNSDDETTIMINIDIAEKFAKSYKMRHKTIIVRLVPRGESGWKSKPNKVKRTWFRGKKDVVNTPVYWYELPTDTFKSKCKESETLTFVGPLSERPYVHIIDPFEEIELRSEEKQSPLTIDDILFACRGLCTDDTRSINSFSVLSDNGSELILMADIDNWST
ncbi:putative ORFan [Tupanvirus deep ocean]|uniref:ORFan n=2 Tax=Tupanvirus TaxID=2094720 RepID=A0AC62A9L3_9VIRU|nr:putative ORFan [Tupanvirus deep ocean]QKU34313.1 putative ORFan [Tupanvirus deep ocean]